MPLDPLATLLSLAAADALGAATEFKSPAEIARAYPDFSTYRPGSVFGFAPGEATDDGQMVVATLLGYGRGEGLSGIARALSDWLAASPPDVGNLTRAALSRPSLAGGAEAWAASGHASAGNGGLMRIAAVNVAGFAGEALAREAAAVTALTHADPRCVIAGVFFVRFLEALGAGEGYDGAARGALAEALDRDTAADLAGAGLLPPAHRAAYVAAEGEARSLVRAAIEAGLRGEVRSQSGYVLDTLQAALAHGRGADWRACVEPAVRLGDDSDTVACVTGAIAGARGLAVPGELLAPLRLGHGWSGWDRAWSCLERFPDVVSAARRARS